MKKIMLKYLRRYIIICLKNKGYCGNQMINHVLKSLGLKEINDSWPFPEFKVPPPPEQIIN